MFKIQNLTKQQAEFTLGRKLSDNAWQAYMTSESRKHRNTVQHLFTDTKVTAYKSRKQKPQFTFSDIAKHAVKKAQRRKSRTQDTDTPYRIAKLFRDNVNSCRIEKVHEYRYNKFKSIRSEWNIYGAVDIIQVHNVITELNKKLS